jgi:uncharacterized Zn-binding protein involved in type VI secretion
MSGAARVGDADAGVCPVGPSSLTGPTTIAAGAGTVFINQKAVARTGDPYGPPHVHIPVPHPAHGVFCGAGSSNVFAEGKSVYRIGDSTACGGTQVGGSGDVIIGG